MSSKLDIGALTKIKEQSSIQEIFEFQYGHWPPKPLTGEIIEHKVTINTTQNRWLIAQKIVCSLKLRIELLKSLPVFYQLYFKNFASDRNLLKALVNFSSSLEKLLKNKKLSKRLIIWPIHIFMFPIISMVYAAKIIKINVITENESYAFVLPTAKHHIYVEDIPEEEIITTLGHECVHLLQNKEPNIMKRKLNNEFFLKEQIKKGYFHKIQSITPGFITYLFSEIEVEARLHEVMAVFYRATGYVPITKLDFISALTSFKFSADFCQFCGDERDPVNMKSFIQQVKSNNTKLGVPFLKLDTFPSLDTDMRVITNMHKDPWFIMSTYLPDCYSRLLGLYGCTADRSNFNQTMLSK